MWDFDVRRARAGGFGDLPHNGEILKNRGRTGGGDKVSSSGARPSTPKQPALAAIECGAPLDPASRALIEILDHAVVSWDAASERILSCNELFAADCAHSADAIAGLPLRKVVAPEFYAQAKPAMEALRTQRFVDRQVRLPGASDYPMFRDVRFARVEDDGKLVAFVARSREVSAQDRYTQALEALTMLEASADRPLADVAREALAIGAELLGLPFAMLSMTIGERRQIISLTAAEAFGFKEGDFIALPGDARERRSGKAGPRAAKADKPCGLLEEPALEGARYSASGDPKFRECEFARPPEAGSPSGPHFGAYLDRAVSASGEVNGAVSLFSDRAPAFGPFTDLQRRFVAHLARWIGRGIEARRRHRALSRSEAELRLIFDNVSQNIWRLDASHRVLWANAGAAQALRRTPENVVGVSAERFMLNLDPHWRAHSEQAMQTRIPIYGVEAQYKPPGEAPVWTSTDLAPDEGAEGTLLVVSTDITPLKEREGELEVAIAEVDHNRRLFERFYRRAPVLLCSFHPDGLIVEASDDWRDKTGYLRDGIVGRRLGEFLEEASRRRAEETLLPGLWRSGACVAAPLQFLHKSGRIVDVELSGYLNAEDGGPPLCMAVLIDVTARNAAEAALERANRELATANEGLKKFAHVASHDLQEPLRKIAQFGDLLATEYRDKLEGDAVFYIDVMRDSADRMRRLIKDILNFSRSMNTTLSRAQISLGDIVRDVVGDLDVAVRDAGAEVAVATLPSLFGDRTAVQLLMRNLIGNSLKYRRPGVAPKVAVAGARTPDGGYAVSVKDNGCGIDERHHAAIFDPFTRLHTRSEVDGSGIGLAICKSVCERQRWRISIKSRVNEGSEFTITVPAADVVSSARVRP